MGLESGKEKGLVGPLERKNPNPRGESLKDLLHGLASFRANIETHQSGFIEAAESLLAGSDIGWRSASLLRFGTRYQELGLEETLRRGFYIGIKTDITDPFVDSMNGGASLYGYNEFVNIPGYLVGIVGIRKPVNGNKAGEFYDGVARVTNAKTQEHEHIAVGVQVNGSAVRVFRHPENLKEEPRTIEEIFPRVK